MIKFLLMKILLSINWNVSDKKSLRYAMLIFKVKYL